MLRSVVFAVLGSALLLSCARPIRVQRLPLDHPANPEAPESPMEVPSRTLRNGPAPASDVVSPPRGHPEKHDHQQEVGKQMKHSDNQPESLAGKVYTCPHHPKVKAATPGRCPKCGMALKKKRSE